VIALNLPSSSFKVKNTENAQSIFDCIRKRYVQLTPEEWVRQHIVHWLLSRKRIPQSLMNVEKQLDVHGRKKRYDIVSYQRDGSIFLIVECKAPHVKIDQSTFDQIAVYNMSLNARYLMVSNGLKHYFCTMDHMTRTYSFLQDLPDYSL
jgi:predicted type IV restriction endonuclease